MVDALKIAAKVAVIVLVMTAVFLVFNNVMITTPNTVYLIQAIGKGKAIIEYWGGSLMLQWLVFAFILMGVKISILTFKISMIAVKWILKVNE